MNESGMRCVTWAAINCRDVRRGYDNDKVKVKVNFHHVRGHEVPEGE